MTQIFLDIGEPTSKPSGFVLLSAGHRPFFLLTALSAIVLLTLWLVAYVGRLALSSSWHAHEMVYGFAVAAISGFLLAAVPHWTNAQSPKGVPLMGLCGLWLLGRIGVFVAEIYPSYAALAYLDLIFLPVMIVVVARMIMGAKNTRNYVVVGIVGALMMTDLVYHFYDSYAGVRAGIFVVTILAALIGGRVIPAFTQNALQLYSGQPVACTTPAWTYKVTLISMFLLVIAQGLDMDQRITGVLAALVAVLLFIRMLGWRSLNSFFDPIVWVLHAAYIWLPIGYGLKAVADLTGLIDGNSALHALTVGGIGMLILAIASRAALGHSGRELRVSAGTVLAYILVLGATIIRVLVLSPEWIIVSGLLWVLGFGLFALVYVPILLKPRVDGLPG
ncbi:MAG: NnrS family protein [Methylocystaceae bacterium]|nr:NnrS family protein [Methylocystaceae bacterium]